MGEIRVTNDSLRHCTVESAANEPEAMPLTPRYTWEEDATSLALHIKLPGTALKHVDLYVSDVLVKVNAPPYVLLLDLFAAVDETSAVVKRIAATHVLHITLRKTDPKLWKQLMLEDTKTALQTRRLESMERKRVAEQALAEKRKDRKHQEEKQTLRAQMAVDDTNRQILADLKTEEKEREERAMYESFKDLQMKQHHVSVGSPTARQGSKADDNQVTHQVDAAPEPKSILKQDEKLKNKRKKRVSFAKDSPPSNQDVVDEILELTADGSFDIAAAPKSIPLNHDTQVESDTSSDEEPQEDKPSPVPTKAGTIPDAKEESYVIVELPAPRDSTTAEITFTPRVFPTPSRESKAAEEEDWLLKNRKHLKKHKGLRGAADAYDISESDPMWLKAKGDDFFRSKDYRSAANAYSEAMTAAGDDQHELLTACLSNRAACNLQLADFERCLQDCSKALTYLPDTAQPPPNHSEGQATPLIKQHRLKLKLLVRRGTALCRLGKFTEAKADYGVALTMDNQNSALQQDYYQLLQLEQADQAKARGDEAFKQNQLDDAISEYNQSLKLHSQSVACLSNRAACFLRCHELQKCVDDCTMALELLQQAPGAPTDTNTSAGLAFFAVGPAAGSAKRRAWVVKTMVRRGTAYAAMHLYDKAEVDYATAVKLDPSNTALQSDLDKIRGQHQGGKVDSGSQEAFVASVP
ncbi:hypothetical protein Poli38472_005556 [Pythium oligandrum]|uniref:CS domain-containing protein n=1 Tax=Pythium oligandrum TaxID=41045 RepID=A0A8K1FLR1_PYTOL|nr:hypothetical protein Poli38472_005556 [Pythium oligandrum]|eukprot:TMW62938.1 hypothetical protein Poli38472_005556 [Pythium oligandrum]